MNKINVYSFDECDYVASPWGVAETQKWYQELTGAGEEEPELVDQKTKGFWDEVPMEEVKGKVITGDKVFGNYGYVGNAICIYRSFSDAIKKLGNVDEPEIIASTEY